MAGIAGAVEDGFAIAAMGFASCPAFAGMTEEGGNDSERLPRCAGNDGERLPGRGHGIVGFLAGASGTVVRQDVSRCGKA